MKKEDLIGDINNRFQLVLVMLLFLPSFMAAALGTVAENDPKEINNLFIKLGGIVVFYLFPYICFELAKRSEKVSEFSFKLMNWILIIGIGSFVIPILVIVMSFSSNHPTEHSWAVSFWIFSYQASLWGIILGGIAASLVAVSYIIQVVFKPTQSRQEE